MKTPQKLSLIFGIVAALCALMVAVVSATPAAPNGPIVISKTVSPQVIDINYTGLLTYTITLTNTAQQGVNSVLTDALPIGLSFNEWVSYPTFGTRTVVGNVITWTGQIPAQPVNIPPGNVPNVVTFVFTAKFPDPATATLYLKGPIVNTAYISTSQGTDSASAVTNVLGYRRYIFLPLVMNNFEQ